MSFFAAYDIASPLFTSSAALALVTGADRSGLLRALAEPRSAAEAASLAGLTEARAEAVCMALTAFDVVVRNGSSFELSPAWQVLASPGAFVDLSVLLAGAEVETRLFRGLGEGLDYWSMPSPDRVTYARSVSPDPFSDDLVAAFRAASAADPDSAALAAGGRYLELGCGVAGRLLVNLRAFPELSAVGVELAEDLVEVARDRAEQLGVTDRLRVVHQDARDFREEQGFDFGFWSQFFFPAPSRPAALATLFRSLKPGGIAWAPCAVDFEAITADPEGPEAKAYALQRLLLVSWGVPERSAAELCDEFADAGFTDISTSGGGGTGPVRVRAVRP